MNTTKLSKYLLFLVIILSLSCTKSKSVYKNPYVAKYHIKFLDNNEDSVFAFQQNYPNIVKNRYVYIAYLQIYYKHDKYKDLLRSNLP